MIALICMLLTLVFIIVALIGPWFSTSSKAESGGIEGEFTTSFYLTRGEIYSKLGDAEGETKSEDYEEDWDGKYIFDNTMYITIFTLIIAILCLVGLLGIMFSFGPEKIMKMFGTIFGILTFVLALVAILYMMTALPGEAELKTKEGDDAGFFYGYSEDGIDYSHGPGYAWYLMLVGAILSLIASIFLLLDKKSAMPVPPQ